MIKAILYTPMVGEVNSEVPESVILERIKSGLADVWTLAEFEENLSKSSTIASGSFLRFIDIPEPFKIKVAFGTELEQILTESEDGKLTEEQMDNYDEFIKEREFDTKAELDAYVLALNDMDGCDTFSIIS